MASAEKRQRRRRSRGAGQPTGGMEGGEPPVRALVGVDAQEKEDSVKSPDYIERLARKYMQKCTVESSTESESESKVEVVPGPLAGGFKKAKNSRGLQFLDPYDGDSEDTSAHSDCSLTSVNIQVASWTDIAPKAMALEDADTSDDGEFFPNPPDWLCSETKVSEIQTANDCKASLDLPSQEDFLLQSPEPPPGSEALPPMWLTPDHALLMSINPSAAGAPQLLQAAHYDGTRAKQLLNKRKAGIPSPEAACEKIRIKKIRAM